MDSNPATCEVVAVPGDLPDQFSTEPRGSRGAVSGAETSGAESDGDSVGGGGGGDDDDDDNDDDRAGGDGDGNGEPAPPPKNVLAPGTKWLHRAADMRAAMSACHPYMRCVRRACVRACIRAWV